MLLLIDHTALYEKGDNLFGDEISENYLKIDATNVYDYNLLLKQETLKKIYHNIYYGR